MIFIYSSGGAGGRRARRGPRRSINRLIKLNSHRLVQSARGDRRKRDRQNPNPPFRRRRPIPPGATSPAPHPTPLTMAGVFTTSPVAAVAPARARCRARAVRVAGASRHRKPTPSRHPRAASDDDRPRTFPPPPTPPPRRRVVVAHRAADRYLTSSLRTSSPIALPSSRDADARATRVAHRILPRARVVVVVAHRVVLAEDAS